MYGRVVKGVVYEVAYHWMRDISLKTISNLVFLCDVETALSYGQRLTNIKYQVVDDGVWSNRFTTILSELAEAGNIEVENTEQGPTIKNCIKSPDTHLTQRAKLTIKSTVEKYCSDEDQISQDVLDVGFVNKADKIVQFPRFVAV